MKNTRIINTLGQAAIICILIVALFVCLKHFATMPYTVYIEANDGGYLPCTYYPCPVLTRTETEIVVDLDGNAYAAWIDDMSTICEGDVVWAGFASYEGNLELIDIK